MDGNRQLFQVGILINIIIIIIIAYRGFINKAKVIFKPNCWTKLQSWMLFVFLRLNRIVSKKTDCSIEMCSGQNISLAVWMCFNVNFPSQIKFGPVVEMIKVQMFIILSYNKVLVLWARNLQLKYLIWFKIYLGLGLLINVLWGEYILCYTHDPFCN